MLVFYHSHPNVPIGTPDDKKLHKPPINAGQAPIKNGVNFELEHYEPDTNFIDRLYLVWERNPEGIEYK